MKRPKLPSATDYVAGYIGSVHSETIKRVFMQDGQEPVNDKPKKCKRSMQRNK